MGAFIPTGSVVGMVNMNARKEASVTWADRAQGKEVRMQGQDDFVRVLLFCEEQFKQHLSREVWG